MTALFKGIVVEIFIFLALCFFSSGLFAADHLTSSSRAELANYVISLSTDDRIDLYQHKGVKRFYIDTRFSDGDLWHEINSPEQFLKFLSAPNATAFPKAEQGGSFAFYTKIVNNSDRRHWVVDFFSSFAENVALYIYKEGELIESVHKGMHQGSDKFLASSANLTDFDIGDELELIYVISSVHFIGKPKAQLVTKEFFEGRAYPQFIIFVICLGAYFILMAYSFVIGVSINDKSFVMYALFLMCGLTFNAALFGFLPEPLKLFTADFLIPVLALATFFSCKYCIYFLELPSNNPRLMKWVNSVAYYSLGVMLLCFILPFTWVVNFYALALVGWFVACITAGIRRYLDGYSPAKFYLLGLTFLSIAGITLLFRYENNFISNNRYFIAYLLQTCDLFIMSLGLANKIYILRTEKEHSQKLALKTKREASRKEQQANIKLKEALMISEKQSQLKTDFLQMVSHELRTPLQSILTSTEEWHKNTNEAARNDLIEYITFGAARLRSQVDNLVILAETDNKKGNPPANAPFELSSILSVLVETAQNLVHKDVSFNEKFAENLPLAFKGDSYVLHHLIRTVLENACQYTREGQILFQVNWLHEESMLKVEISDTGCGMTREQERAMFNEFVQVSRGLHRNSQGLGLGLTICYRLCELLNADFVMNSLIGEGTHVRIMIPLRPLIETKLKEDKSPLLARTKGRVLVVEDNPVNAQVICRVIENIGYSVDLATSGQEAIEKVTEFDEYQVIFMDIQMPVMDGITATRWIKRRGMNISIVGVSANSDAQVRNKCLEVGMNDFLVKPVRRGDIKRVIDYQYSLNK